MKSLKCGPCGLFCGACGATDCDGCLSDNTDDWAGTSVVANRHIMKEFTK